MHLSQLFRRCIHRAYVHTAHGGDYATDRMGNTLYVYLECSDGLTDWKNNFDFPAKAHGTVKEARYLAHRGFLRVWKGMETRLSPLVEDRTLERIVTVGYSHGAALAVLCHAYIYERRPDLRHAIEGYGFGCPRVVWMMHSKKAMKRWERFSVIRNVDDLVTHLPPRVFGFVHVGRLLEIGVRRKYGRIDAHRPENLLHELVAWERTVERD